MHGTPTTTSTPTRYDHFLMQTVAADPVHKIGVLADYVAAIYHQYAVAKATQLIYCETVVVYAEITRELLARGVAEAEIAFIQDHDTKTKKAKLFAAVNQGTIRVLLCSKQSTGMNIQQRLIALHHVDCPWRPGDLEQREGRIVRQGNSFPEVMLFAYATEGSFDGYKWQTVETKASFIEQMKRGDVTMREIDDIGDAVMSAAEMKAIASGNPLVMEKVKLDMALQQLEAGEAADRGNRVKLRRRLLDEANERERLCDRIAFLRAAQAHAAQHAPTSDDTFSATVLQSVMSNEATAYTKRDAAGEAVLKIMSELTDLAIQRKERQSRVIGQYRGFQLIGLSFMMGGAETTISFSHEGSAMPIATTSVSLKTPTGVFQSADYQIKGIAGAITTCTQRIAELDRSETTILSFLETPWSQGDELRLARQRLERINAELAAAAEVHPDEGQPLPLPAPAIPDPDPAPSGELVVVATNHDAHLAEPITFALFEMQRPLVLLPEPANQAGLDAAIHILSGQPFEAQPREEIAPLVVETLVAAPAEVSAARAEVSAAPVEPIFIEQTPEIVSIAAPAPATAPKARVSFGDLFAIQRAKAAKRTSRTKAIPPAQTHTMFESTQLSMF